MSLSRHVHLLQALSRANALRARLTSQCTIPSTGSSQFYSDPVCSDLLSFSPSAAEDVHRGHFRVVPGFVTSAEEQSVVMEVARAMRGRKYQYDHWDGAIEGYKETEKTQWMDVNLPLMDRLRRETAIAMEGEELEPLNEIHVLDLAADGEIKPHIDSVKFCGDAIAGISLLSSSVMRLQHQDDPGKWIHALLPRRSLYIMSGAVRYTYTHAIPKGEHSIFRDKLIARERRLSIICRTTTKTTTATTNQL